MIEWMKEGTKERKKKQEIIYGLCVDIDYLFN